MDTRLVGYEVLARLEKCAPRVGSAGPEVAREILKILLLNTLAEKCKSDLDGKPFWSIDLTDICIQMPPTVSPKIVGSVCRSMGLYLWRRNSGYFLAWNKSQLEILLDYFQIQ
jgi:hypothetical protein